jgi:hypothetical protein
MPFAAARALVKIANPVRILHTSVDLFLKKPFGMQSFAQRLVPSSHELSAYEVEEGASMRFFLCSLFLFCFFLSKEFFSDGMIVMQN